MTKYKDPKQVAPFWVISNWLHIGTGSRAEDRRTIVDFVKPKPYPAMSRLTYGHGVVSPTDIPVFDANIEYQTSPPDDFPWPVDEMFLVSDRVRQLLEAVAPGNCQFFPTRLWHNAMPCDLIYWALYVDSVDCADAERSGRSGGSICDPVIVEERVPPQTHIFRVWYPDEKFSSSRMFVRDGLRRILKREKVTGCMFFVPPEPSASALQSRQGGIDSAEPRRA